MSINVVNVHSEHNSSLSSNEPSRKPRSPKPETLERLERSEKPTVPRQKEMSTLSVNATEFIPHQNEFISEYEVSQLQEVIPENYPFDYDNHAPGDGDRQDRYETLLYEISNTILFMKNCPGNLNDFVNPLCSKLLEANFPDILDDLVSIIYNECIKDNNFTYFGARMCHRMCEEFKDSETLCNFRSALLRRCQEDYNRRDALMSSQEGVGTLCGLSIFIGEVFLNVTVTKDEFSEHLSFLTQVLINLMLSLLSSGLDNTVCTACKLLKLVGALTEDAVEHDASLLAEFDRIFSLLTNMKSSSALSRNNKFLIDSVLALRLNNWDRLVSDESNHDTSFPQAELAALDISSSDNIQYTEEDLRANLDLTEEEDAFLENEVMGVTEKDYVGEAWTAGVEAFVPQACSGNNEANSVCLPFSYDDYVECINEYKNDEMMNEDEEKAFTEFLASQK